MKIAITGIGGVGGYFGGLLAKQYFNSEIEIFFIARGAHEKATREKGLVMNTMNGNFIVHPKNISSDASTIGVVDLILCCTKGYDLEEAMLSVKACIGNNTVLLPLLNGVDAKERLQKIYPGNEIWDGCVYLVARRTAPGVISETGNIRKLFFGAEEGTKEKLQSTEKIFQDAGIDATWSKNIKETIWEKYLFISPMATVTSFLDKTIGEVFSNKKSEELLNQLVAEIKSVAGANGISLPGNVTTSNIEKLKSLPPEATTSMHSDFRRGGRTELESLTGYVIRLAASKGIPVPTYEIMYEMLRQKSSE